LSAYTEALRRIRGGDEVPFAAGSYPEALSERCRLLALFDLP